MSKLLFSFLGGLLFAIGLVVSGMTHPAKVIGFLDLFGDWDPSLVFVMVGAIATLMSLTPIIKGLRRPLLAETFTMPTRRDLDKPLVIGALLFGAGWGLVGYCPGPALVSIPTLEPQVFLFLGALGGGMFAHSLWTSFRNSNA